MAGHSVGFRRVLHTTSLLVVNVKDEDIVYHCLGTFSTFTSGYQAVERVPELLKGFVCLLFSGQKFVSVHRSVSGSMKYNIPWARSVQTDISGFSTLNIFLAVPPMIGIAKSPLSSQPLLLPYPLIRLLSWDFLHSQFSSVPRLRLNIWPWPPEQRGQTTFPTPLLVICWHPPE